MFSEWEEKLLLLQSFDDFWKFSKCKDQWKLSSSQESFEEKLFFSLKSATL